MTERRWHHRLGPPVLAIVVLGLAGVGQPHLGPSPVARSASLEAPPGASVSAQLPKAQPASVLPGPCPASSSTWFRLIERLDSNGAIVGNRVLAGLLGSGPAVTLDVAAEAFAADVGGGRVLVGTDDGQRSRLLLVGAGGSCQVELATEIRIIRRATLDPTNGDVYALLLARADRADLGIWRLTGAGTSAAASPTWQRVLPPIIGVDPVADQRIGPTWATTLAWGTDGTRLAVQSCGIEECRTRILDPASGTVQALAEDDQGPLVALAGDWLVTWEACNGRPCTIRRIRVTGGTPESLAVGAGSVATSLTASGLRIALEVTDGPGIGILSVDPAGGTRRLIRAGTADTTLRLVASGAETTAGASVPAGWLLLTAEGQPPSGALSLGGSPAIQAAPVLIRADDGRTLSLVTTVSPSEVPK